MESIQHHLRKREETVKCIDIYGYSRESVYETKLFSYFVDYISNKLYLICISINAYQIVYYILYTAAYTNSVFGGVNVERSDTMEYSHLDQA